MRPNGTSDLRFKQYQLISEFGKYWLKQYQGELVSAGGPVAEALDDEVRQLREELHRTRRERDILKKALAIFSQQE